MSSPLQSATEFARQAQQFLSSKSVDTIPHSVDTNTGTVIWRPDFSRAAERDFYVPRPFLSLPGIPSTSEQFRSFLFSDDVGDDHLAWEYRRAQLEIDYVVRGGKAVESEGTQAVAKDAFPPRTMGPIEVRARFWSGNLPVDESYQVDEDSTLVQSARHLLRGDAVSLQQAADSAWEAMMDALEAEDDERMVVESLGRIVHGSSGDFTASCEAEEHLLQSVYCRERETLKELMTREITSYVEILAAVQPVQRETEGRIVIPAGQAQGAAGYYHETGWAQFLGDAFFRFQDYEEERSPAVIGVMLYHGFASAIDLRHWSDALSIMITSTAHHEAIGDEEVVRDDKVRTVWVAQQGIQEVVYGQLVHPSFGIASGGLQMANEVLKELISE